MKREFVELTSLLLSGNNPRLEPSANETETISKMVEDQNDKLLELASDIVEHGLNPLDTIAVYPSEKDDEHYYVGEGNRRVCVLKLLEDPSLIEGINDNLSSKFRSLTVSYRVPETIEVGVFDNEESLLHWMEIRHMGEQNGKGLSPWNSIQKARFGRIQSGSDALLDFWDWLIESDILTNDEIHRVTKTNWQRILREKYFPFLRLQFDGHYFVLPRDLEDFTERIRAVQRELDGKTVAIVYDQERIEKFYNLISENLYGKPYQQVVDQESEQLPLTALTFDNPDSESENKEQSSQDVHTIPNQPGENEDSNTIIAQSIGKDVFNGCKTIIPYGYSIRSTNMRINKIINELKRLYVDVYPNACGTLLRTLFELSAKWYLERLDGQDHTGEEFASVIRGAANSLRNQGRLSDSDHSSLIKDVNIIREIFNGYMHDTDVYPSSEALKGFFKSHHTFIEECQK